MTYKLAVVTDADQSMEHRNSLWDRFTLAMSDRPDKSIRALTKDEYRAAVKRLPEFNAQNIAASRYIAFDTEEDAIAFKLRFM